MKKREDKKKIDTGRLIFAIVGFVLILIGFAFIFLSLTGITGFATGITTESMSISGLLGIFFTVVGMFFLSKTRRKRRGQAAMEFLLTYGWAILAAIIAVATLAVFGVFNPSFAPTSPEVFTSWPFTATAGVDTSRIEIEITYHAPDNINVQTVSVDSPPQGFSCLDYTTATPMQEGQSIVVVIPCDGLDADSILKTGITILYTKSGSTIQQKSGGEITQIIQQGNPKCNDGIDNDGDGWQDFEDPGCWSESGSHTCVQSEYCGPPLFPNCEDNDEADNTCPQHCADQIDNDEDGNVDGNDPECLEWNDIGESECSNGVDDENILLGRGDGWVDISDPGCHSDGIHTNPDSYEPHDNDETNPFPNGQCHDEIDNDLDNDVDGYDSYCPQCAEEDGSPCGA